MLRSALGDALGGRGRFVLLAGEPGIGKSRLVSELAVEAREAGAAVLWGRCWEAGGAPAFWPWVQPLRALARALAPDELRSHLGGGAAHVAEILPELRELLPGLLPPPALDPDSARFRLFEAVAGLLQSAARVEPLVVALDDVHVADTPSLLLLQFLAGQLGDVPVLVLAAHRDAELGEGDPLAATVAEMLRHPHTRRLRLGGLSEHEVARFIDLTTGVAPPTGVAAAVHDETDGNPLFVGEIVRLLAGEGLLERPARAWRHAVPEGVRQVIARRLGDLSEETDHVLALAAVLGREFDVAALETLTGRRSDRLLGILDEAIAAGIVIESPGAVGRLRFSHALVRDTLYERLPVARRVALHRAAGEALERRYAGDVEPHLTELAHHFVQAAPAGEVEKAVDYAHRAGDQAVSVVAYEEAVRLFELALDTIELEPVVDPRHRCELLLGLGDAEARAGIGPSSKATFLRAAEFARRLADADLLARAALGYGGRFLWARAGGDPELVPLLEEALGTRDGALKVQVMARLAGALRDQRDRGPRDELSREAVEMARRLGDPRTLAYALDARCFAIFGPENPEERLAIAEEWMAVAERAGDLERAQQARFFGRIAVPLELGDLATVRAEVDSVGRLTDQLRQPPQLWFHTVTRATLALFEGRFADGEELAERALELGRGAQARDAVLSHSVQRFTLGMLRGGVEAVEGAVRRSIVDYPARPMFRCMLAYLLAETGREAEARAVFDALAEDRFATLPLTNEWLFSLGFLADAAAALDDVERAGVLYELMLPYTARNACTPDYIATGSVARPAGVAAATARRWRDAGRLFEDALEANARMGARPWAARTAYDWARMLIRRDGPGDRERAVELLDRALADARELGMAPLEDRAAAAGEARRAAGEPSGRPSVFRREGEYWTIAYEADAFRLKDSKGLRYIAHLLAAPGREVHALALVAAERGEVGPSLGGDAGEIIDTQAQSAYRRRITALEDEIEEARAFGDSERAAALEHELDFLVRELAGALGLHGRRRRTGRPAERARVSVTRAIRAAMPRIREHSPELGEHLERTIHTGTFCSYVADPRSLADWHL